MLFFLLAFHYLFLYYIKRKDRDGASRPTNRQNLAFKTWCLADGRQDNPKGKASSPTRVVMIVSRSEVGFHLQDIKEVDLEQTPIPSKTVVI